MYYYNVITQLQYVILYYYYITVYYIQCYIMIILLLESFSHQGQLMAFPWSLNNNMSPQVSRTLHRILAHTPKCCSLDCLPSTCYFQVLQSFYPSSVSRAPKKVGITVTYMFHSFFQFPCEVQVLNLLFLFFQFYSVVNRDHKVQNYYQ